MLKRMLKKLNRRNEGVTLVEIIVSLLILAIIFAPMLTSYVTANRANVAAKEKMYATVLGENVMEAVKVLGIEGTAKQFYLDPANKSSFVLANGDSSLAFNEETHSKPSVVDGKFSNARGTEDYVYCIYNAIEGTQVFDVRITFSSKNYTSTGVVTPPAEGGATPTPLPNNYSFADMSAFNATSTAMINAPVEEVTADDGSVSYANRFDAMARTYYKQLNENYMQEKWLAACVAEQDRYTQEELAYEAAIERGESATPPAPLNLPSQDAPEYIPLSAEQIDALISREMTVTISQHKDENGKDAYFLDSSIVFKIDNKGSVCGSSPTDTFERTYTGYCSTAAYETLQSIYLIYMPFQKDYKFLQEKVSIDNQVDYKTDDEGKPVSKFDVYIAVQAPAEKNLKTEAGNLTVNVQNAHTYTYEDVNYSDVTLYSSVNLATVNMRGDSLLKDITKSSERLYDVKVEVFEAGGSFSKVVDSVASTVIR